MQDWQDMSAAELGRAIEVGAADPVDLAEHFLDEIEAHELGPRIFARLTRDRALAEARAARERAAAGLRLSPLDGVPVSWKDLFDTAGTATEAGSKLLQGRIPDRDAVVLRNATAMGLVCLGKTHMSELAFSGLGVNPSTATAPNRNWPGGAPGGSSSGAAASVAHGLAPAAIGSDTGGSVRLPAAWNDLVGLKTTHGRLSLEGVVPLCLRLDTVGPLTRTVEDAALLLGALEGRPGPDLRGATLRGARFGILDSVAMDGLVEPVRTAFETAVERLVDAGAQVTRFEVPQVAEAMEVSAQIYTAEAYGLWKDVIEAAPDKMYGPIRDRFRMGAGVSGPDYVAHWARVRSIRAVYDEAAARFDAVLTPTAPNLPPDLSRLESDNEYYVTQNLLTLRNTRIGNLMGICGLTLPTGTAGCGLQIMCAPGLDARLLRLGAAAEAALA